MPKVAGNARFGRIAIWRPSIPDAAPYFLVTNARFNLRDYLIELSGGVVDALLRDRNDSDSSPIPKRIRKARCGAGGPRGQRIVVGIAADRNDVSLTFLDGVPHSPDVVRTRR